MDLGQNRDKKKLCIIRKFISFASCFKMKHLLIYHVPLFFNALFFLTKKAFFLKKPSWHKYCIVFGIKQLTRFYEPLTLKKEVQ